MNRDSNRKWNIFIFVLSLAGALAWTPYLCELFKPAKVQCKLIGWLKGEGITGSRWDDWEGKQITTKGILYLPRLSVTSLNKDINVKDIQIIVKYPKDQKEYIGQSIILDKINVDVKDSDGVKHRKLIVIPQEEQAGMLSVIGRNDVQLFFVPFMLDKAIPDKWESIEFRFIDYSDNSYSYTIKFSDIDWFALPGIESYIVTTYSTSD